MAYIPTRFKRITAAFDDDARARLCQSSSGSEHSAENSVTDLSDLVDSFFEVDVNDRFESNVEKRLEEKASQDAGGFFGTDTDTKETLIELIGGSNDDEDDRTKRAILFELETVCWNLNDASNKRNIMTLLRQKGFDAGLCKSRWGKSGGHPGGEYEYVDVLLSSGDRYIVEVSIGAEFTIARPTKAYESLLDIMPKFMVIKPNELKKVVRLMCAAMRASLRSREMLVSPWRKNGYMQSKWFGSYKRTTNSITEVVGNGEGEFTGESLLGFEYSAAVGGGRSNCRKEVGRLHVW